MSANTKEIRIPAQYQSEREMLVTALVNLGHTVRIVESDIEYSRGHKNYFVMVKIKEQL